MKRMHSDHQHWFVNSYFFLLFLPIFFFSYSQNVFWGWRMRWTSKLSTDSIPQFFFSLFVSKRINQFDDRIQQNRHAKNWRHSITVSLLTLNSFFSCFGQTSDLRPHQPTNRWWVSRADRPRKSYKPNNRSIQFYSTENLPNRICEHVLGSDRTIGLIVSDLANQISNHTQIHADSNEWSARSAYDCQHSVSSDQLRKGAH